MVGHGDSGTQGHWVKDVTLYICKIMRYTINISKVIRKWDSVIIGHMDSGLQVVQEHRESERVVQMNIFTYVQISEKI